MAIIFLLTLAVGWAIFVGLARLGCFPLSLTWPKFNTVDNTKTPIRDLAIATVTAAGLFAGGFAIVYAYRKQRVDEAASKRADEEAFSKRYQDAAEQIGHEKAAVRLAGVYAMARLADDWVEQRQTCIDVLCAYLRMPWEVETAPGGEHQGELQVRRAVVRLLEIHLRATSEPSWSSLHFDFSHSQFWELGMSILIFDQPVIFYGAHFKGETKFEGITFRRGATFMKARFQGRVTMYNLVALGESIRFGASTIDENDKLEFSTASIGPDTRIRLENLRVKGFASFKWTNTVDPQGQYYLRRVTVYPTALFELIERDDYGAQGTTNLPNIPSIDANWVRVAKSATTDLPDTIKVTMKADDEVEYRTIASPYSTGEPEQGSSPSRRRLGLAPHRGSRQRSR